MALRILAGGAAQSLVERAKHGFEIDGTFSAVGAMRDKLLAGDPADIVILSRALVEGLAESGHVVASTMVDVAKVATAVAVRQDDPLPGIGDKAGLAAPGVDLAAAIDTCLSSAQALRTRLATAPDVSPERDAFMRQLESLSTAYLTANRW